MSDLVERLREFGEMPMEGGKVDPVIETINGLAHEAADEIESLRTRITELEGERDTATRALAEMRTALEAINRRASPDPSRTFDDVSRDLYWCACEARAALSKTEGKG